MKEKQQKILLLIDNANYKFACFYVYFFLKIYPNGHRIGESQLPSVEYIEHAMPSPICFDFTFLN